VLLNLGAPGSFDITPWSDRVQLIDAQYVGKWKLPAIGAVRALTAALVRPDGYVAWVGDLPHVGLADALITWFGRLLQCSAPDSKTIQFNRELQDGVSGHPETSQTEVSLWRCRIVASGMGSQDR
jgi:hypothetical protein